MLILRFAVSASAPACLFFTLACGEPSSNVDADSDSGVADDGDGVGASDGAGGMGVRIEIESTSLQRLSQSVCDYYSRCQFGLTHLYGEGQECEDLYAAGIEWATLDEPALVPIYEGFAACDVLENTPCPSSSTLFESQVMTNAVVTCLSDFFAKEGDSCEGDACGPGLRCTGATDTMCGECELSAEGWCEEHYDCEAPQFCDDTTNRCADFFADGEVCESSFDCHSRSCQAGICRKPGRVGDGCDDVAECDFTLNCVSGTCRAPGGEGDSCQSSSDCRYSFVCEGGACLATGLSGIPIGGPCRLYGCGEGAYCDSQDEVCKSDAVGEPCRYSCGFERACIDEQCAELVVVGGGCSSDNDCESSNCVDEVCAEELRCGSF